MSDASSTVAKLGAHPGLCLGCAHRLLNETRRGTAYLRCGLASTNESLPRYPRLPVRECHGFTAAEDGAPEALDK